MSCQTLPEGDAPISATGQDPGVWHSLGFGAHTHVRIQAKAQQEAAQQGGVILTVPLGRTDRVWIMETSCLVFRVLLALIKGQHTFVFNIKVSCTSRATGRFFFLYPGSVEVKL